jgi:predicted nucleic acid-binding protein
MVRRVLDTNVLIEDFRGLQPYAEKKTQQARTRAQALIHDKNTKAILSPIEIEFLGGICDRHEMELAEAYLAEFQVIDEHKTLPQDWEEARRVAKHIGHNTGPRQLGDCLIIAICNRLRYELPISKDRGLRRQLGRTRHRRS